MGKRIMSAGIMLVLLFSVLYVHYVLNIAIMNYVVALLALAALFEMYKASGITKHKVVTFLGFAAGECIVFGNIENGIYTLAVLSAAIMLLLIAAVLMYSKITFRDISIVFTSTVYISFGMAYLRILLENNCGFGLLFAVLIGALMTDVGGYFVGNFFGKHKLIEKISPQKTVEGAFGGVIFALASYVIYGLIVDHMFPVSTNWAVLMTAGAIASVIAQFGDLTASMIKREMGIKDYSNLIPGHGGIMDRIDSILFVAPVIYYAHTFFGILV